MTWGFLTDGFEIPWKRFLAVVMLFSPSLVWFYIFHVFLLEAIFTSLSTDSTWIYVGKTLFYISIACSAILGSMISERVVRRRLLGFWVFSGVVSTALFTVFHGLGFFLLLTVLLGASFGVGFPACTAFLADATSIEERARVSGFVILVTFIMLSLILQASQLLDFEVTEFLLVSIILRSISFFTLLVDPCETISDKKKGWFAILTTKGFGLYFLSWLLFNTANGVLAFVESGLQQSLEYKSAVTLGSLFQYICTSLFALISGVMSDRFGRKDAIIFGLITLGISYAFLGFATSPTSYLITKITSGIAWGFIMVTYALTVLGDLASNYQKERFYALGGIVPLFLFLTFQLMSEVFNLSVSTNIVSSILSILLFVSVIPLLYAPETLPSDKVRARRFREYIKKVRNLLEKDS